MGEALSPNDPSGGGQGGSTGTEPTQEETAGTDDEVVEFFRIAVVMTPGVLVTSPRLRPLVVVLLPPALYALKPRSLT